MKSSNWNVAKYFLNLTALSATPSEKLFFFFFFFSNIFGNLCSMIRFCHLPMVRFVCMRTLIFLENKQTNNTFSRLSCGKKLLKSWQLQLHVLPGQDRTCPSMTYLSILPLCQAAMSPPNIPLTCQMLLAAPTQRSTAQRDGALISHLTE